MMASIAEGGRAVVAKGWQRLPEASRGHWRRVQPLNRFALLLGAAPTAHVEMRLGHRLLLDLRSGTEWLAYYSRDFDDRLIVAACALVTEPGSIAIDAGANIGFWAVPLASRVAALNGRLLAFEPVPFNAERLKFNLAINGYAAYAEVVQAALSDRTRNVVMVLREDFTEGAATGNASISIDDDEDRKHSSLPAPAVTLDEFLRDRPEVTSVKIIKVDVEGHEDRLLAGAAETLSTHRPIVFVEWNRAYYDRRHTNLTAAVEPLLRRLEYRTLRRGQAGWCIAADFNSPRPFDDLVVAPSDTVSTTLAALNADGGTRRGVASRRLGAI
jgi:FkbM family methyltransferase